MHNCWEVTCLGLRSQTRRGVDAYTKCGTWPTETQVLILYHCLGICVSAISQKFCARWHEGTAVKDKKQESDSDECVHGKDLSLVYHRSSREAKATVGQAEGCLGYQ